VNSRLLVSVDIDGDSVPAGAAFIERSRNSTTTTFRYDDEYLARPTSYALDPALSMFEGPQSTNGLPGAFRDTSPDRWGRSLIAKRIRSQAAVQGAQAPSIGEVDYLVGVSDVTRQGALRFRESVDSPYLDPEANVPKLIALAELLRASEAVARDEVDDMAAIKALLDAGTGSLGGARPKASVRSDDGLLIAKFPHHHDRWDVMGWEKTVLDLAERAGIPAPERDLIHVGDKRALLLRRFDRAGTSRVGYMSAMTLIGGSDGGDYDYVDIAQFLPEHGAAVSEDLAQLWRRVVFSIAVHNTDDHMRNHGFLRHGAGWRLSPIFDVNPNPNRGETRATSIAGAGSAEEIDGVMALAADCGLSVTRARQIIGGVLEATAPWRDVATRNGIPESSQARFTDAFEARRAELSNT